MRGDERGKGWLDSESQKNVAMNDDKERIEMDEEEEEEERDKANLEWSFSGISEFQAQFRCCILDSRAQSSSS